MPGVIQTQSGGGGLGKLLGIAGMLATGGALGAGMAAAGPWLTGASQLLGGDAAGAAETVRTPSAGQQQQAAAPPQAPSSFSDAWMRASYPEYAQSALHNPWRR